MVRDSRLEEVRGLMSHSKNEVKRGIGETHGRKTEGARCRAYGDVELKGRGRKRKGISGFGLEK